MNWSGVTAAAALVGVAFVCGPWGLLLVAVAAVVLWKSC